MDERYEDDQIKMIWSREEWVHQMEKVSTAVMTQRGVDPEKLATARVTHTTAEVVADWETQTKHEVTAFLKAWTAMMPGEVADEVHLGMTSSDLVDTVSALQLQKTYNHLDSLTSDLLGALIEFADKYWTNPRIGRTHGQWAEPTTIGYRFGGLAQRVRDVQREISFLYPRLVKMKLSGAVGTYPLGYDLQKHVALALGLQCDMFSTQCVARDARASYVCLLAQLAGVVEELSLEVRHSSRPEIGEIFENFTDGQTGSSAMPHKQNPIAAENLTGLARLARGYVGPVLESMALLHERDISHSSVERVALVDAFHCAATILKRATLMVKGLRVDTYRAYENLMQVSNGVWATGQALTMLVQEGWSRDEAYETVQRAGALAGQRGASSFWDHLTRLAKEKDLPLPEHVGYFDRTDLMERLRPAKNAMGRW